jgi:hypothetical protein
MTLSTAELDPRLASLGDALLAATEADLADGPPQLAPSAGRRHRRLTRPMALVLVAAVVAVPGAALAAQALLGTDDVERSMPAGTLMLAGTEPSCTVVRDQVEYRCTLKHAPSGEIAPGQMKGVVEPTVDRNNIVNGGCRSLDPDGRTWNCYVGEAAVEQRIIGRDFLGQRSEGPGVG